MVLISFATDTLALQIGNRLNMYFFKYNMREKQHLMAYLGWATDIFSFVLIAIVGWYIGKLGKGIILVEAVAIVPEVAILSVRKKKLIWKSLQQIKVKKN